MIGEPRLPLTLQRSRSFRGFTLVEVLVVLFLLLLLASIALPNVKELIANQRVSRAARGMAAYIDAARNRAISQGQQVGVLIERFGYTDARGRAHSIRMRHLTSLPPYTGDASNGVAILQPDGISATFDPSSNPLMALSASMVADPSDANDVDDLRAPIRNRDFIEFPGGRVVPFFFDYRPLTAGANVPVRITFDLNEFVDPINGITPLFPSSGVAVPSERPVKFKIHRRPVVSTVSPFSLPRGIVLDLNYSGLGVAGNQFAPDDDPSVPVYDVAIVFGPDGKVVSVSNPLSGFLVPPIGRIFLCMGDSDGVRPDDLFSQEKRAIANLLNPESLWIVVDPATGRIDSAPFAPVASIPAGLVTDPADATLDVAIAESRFFANLSDTVDLE